MCPSFVHAQVQRGGSDSCPSLKSELMPSAGFGASGDAPPKPHHDLLSCCAQIISATSPITITIWRRLQRLHPSSTSCSKLSPVASSIHLELATARTSFTTTTPPQR